MSYFGLERVEAVPRSAQADKDDRLRRMQSRSKPSNGKQYWILLVSLTVDESSTCKLLQDSSAGNLIAALWNCRVVSLRSKSLTTRSSPHRHHRHPPRTNHGPLAKFGGVSRLLGRNSAGAISRRSRSLLLSPQSLLSLQTSCFGVLALSVYISPWLQLPLQLLRRHPTQMPPPRTRSRSRM